MEMTVVQQPTNQSN